MGIDHRYCSPGEIAKWFLASILFAARISEGIAKKTYSEFDRRGINTPRKIAGAGRDELVAILDSGGYVRYDFKTADKLLEVFGHILKDYDGDLNRLHEEARDSINLEERLKELGKGDGDVTVAIFLREMRLCWAKADPKPTRRVTEAMRSLGIKDIKKYAHRNSLDLQRLETALGRWRAKRKDKPRRPLG